MKEKKKIKHSLESECPELAAQWHSTRNGNLQPADISYKSGKTVWWMLPFDDPETGKHFDFEWKAKICNRANGTGCPVLASKAVWPGYNDLATKYPSLSKEWHPTKNGVLKPTEVTCFSKKEVWWLLPYDDPKTGKHFDFEWKAKIADRVKGCGCPYLSSRDLWVGYNDFATNYPDLAKEWHPTKNGDTQPSDLLCHSNRKVWWYLPYVDSESGKFFEFEWEASVCNRVEGCGCPYTSGRKCWVGYNDLATQMPELAKEWHPTKNGSLRPTDVCCHSDKKVWWYCPYDDPISGKHFDFEWEARISNRSQGTQCPVFSGKMVWSGFNDLATTNPELAKEWHPIKNGNLYPTDVTHMSNKKVWWLLPYDDPITGKHFEFEWEAIIHSRVAGNGCPYISGVVVQKGYNDLATKKPELAKEWHPTKNGDLRPTDVTCYSDKKVWWLLPYDDPITGKHFEFEWESKVSARVKSNKAPFLSGQMVWPQFNDLATRNPDLAKEWHPTKNGKLKPTDITCMSSRMVWWYKPYYDSETGKHFDFEWQARVHDRSNGCGCPYLSGEKIWASYNSLAAKNPNLAKEWHPTKNGCLQPTDVGCYSSKKVWWYYPYDDPDTGKHFIFEWEATVSNRSKGGGCPVFSGRMVWEGFNDLATKNPDLAKEWHPTKNGKLKPTDITCMSNRKVWWYLPYDDPVTGKHFDFEWKATVNSRVKGSGCPFVAEKRVWFEYNDLETCFPNIAREWHPSKNRKSLPTQVYKGEGHKVWWQCLKCGYEWRATVRSRTYEENGCPKCRGNQSEFIL